MSKLRITNCGKPISPYFPNLSIQNKPNKMREKMKSKNRIINLVVIGSIAIMVGLAGCSDASQSPVATTIPTNTSTSVATYYHPVFMERNRL